MMDLHGDLGNAAAQAIGLRMVRIRISGPSCMAARPAPIPDDAPVTTATRPVNAVISPSPAVSQAGRT